MLLIEAIKASNLNLVQEIIYSGVDVNKIEYECILTPLELAVYLGHFDIVRALLEAGASIDVENYSPLESAIAKGHKDVVALLIELYPYTKDSSVQDKNLKPSPVKTFKYWYSCPLTIPIYLC